MRLNPYWLYARSRKILVLIMVLLVTVIVAAFAPTGLVGVPVRNTVTTLVVPLLATLPGLALGASLASPCRELETVGLVSAIALRATWVSAIWGVSTIVIYLSLGAAAGMTAIVLRNYVLTLGITTLASTILPPGAAWLPAACFGAANGIYGTIDMVATAKWWAILQHSSNSLGAMIVSLVLGIAGPSIWIWRGSKA